MRRLFTRQVRPGRPSRRRPFGVIVITILQLAGALAPLAILGLANTVQAASLLAYLRNLEPVNFFIFETLEAYFHAWQLPGITPVGVVAMIILILAAVRVAIIAGFWYLKRWGWVLLMVQLGLLMLFDLYAYFSGAPNYFSMLNSVLVVFYLNQREVQQAFQARRQVVEAL
jgi:hypothetical protein